ncbi:hypothetical protein L207DRAFT_562060 [Hyaloscypha variabilis F]|uniref:Zn(2)-C6 fungal-type domain-containing protein n=1 Tax=Hyaloscypha variabilis (strain UAMH 11265 / GT02V1 / F) TaxID=1149755 RepID=A0A2J6S7R5_HYAVF|nr:hypothetical protein L207DRAFT_562060 [Hyaloscypha variabilis F]
MSQVSAQVVSGGRGGGGRGGSGRKPQHVVRKGAIGTACDACNRDHQPCRPSDPTNPLSICIRCADTGRECTYDRQQHRRRRPGDPVRSVTRSAVRRPAPGRSAAGQDDQHTQIATLLSQGYTITLNPPAPATINVEARAPIQFPPVTQNAAVPANNTPQGYSSRSVFPPPPPNVDPSLDSYTLDPETGLFAPPRSHFTPDPGVAPAASPSHSLLGQTGITNPSPFSAPPLSASPSPTPAPAHGPPPHTFSAAPQLPFPSIETFRNMAFEGDREELFHHYFEQSRGLSEEDRATAEQVLDLLLRAAQTARGAGGNMGGH